MCAENPDFSFDKRELLSTFAVQQRCTNTLICMEQTSEIYLVKFRIGLYVPKSIRIDGGGYLGLSVNETPGLQSS